MINKIKDIDHSIIKPRVHLASDREVHGKFLRELIEQSAEIGQH